MDELTDAPPSRPSTSGSSDAPPPSSVAHAAFRRLARSLGVLKRWLPGAGAHPPTYLLTRWLFLRLLGLVALAAFLSLWVQIDGLIGSRGILPASNLLREARAEASNAGIGRDLYRMIPTLFW